MTYCLVLSVSLPPMTTLNTRVYHFFLQVAPGPSPPMRWIRLQEKSVADQQARELRAEQVPEKLNVYYGKVNPEKQNPSAIRALVDAYDGRWDDLNQLLEAKYGVSPNL